MDDFTPQKIPRDSYGSTNTEVFESAKFASFASKVDKVVAGSWLEPF
jgi:hypothetical protein